MKNESFLRISSLVFVFLAQACMASAAGLYAAAPQDCHKLRVEDAALARQIEQSGGRLVADYGGFSVLEVNRYGAQELSALGGIENLDAQNSILLNAGVVDTTSGEVRAARPALRALAGKALHLVQFVGPVKAEWVAELESAGAKIVTYIPQNAYLVYADSAALARIGALAQAGSVVQWSGAYLDTDKIQPRVASALAGNNIPATDQFAIQLVEDESANALTRALIDRIKLAPVKREERRLGYVNIIVRLPLGQVSALAARPDVVSIALYIDPKKLDERQDQIVAGNLTGALPSGPGYLNWLYSKGFTQSQFTASGFVVDVTDSGVDRGTNPPNHFGLFVNGDTGQTARVAYNRLEGTPNDGSTNAGCDGHGNLNAHIIAGYNNLTGFPHADSSGYRYGLGVCPFVKVGSSVIFDPGSFTYPTYDDLISRAYRDGARISSDSWGADTYGDYDLDAQNYDALVRDAQPAGSAVPVAGNQGMTIVFAAGNAGSAAGTVGSPGTAKNVITVGAAENVHSHSTANGGNNAAGNDGCGTPDTEANSADDIASFSSRGPCSDLRKKPDVVAPGTHVTGGVGQQIRSMTGNGNDLACFDASGVCGLLGSGGVGTTSNFFPLGQQFFTTSSGTSHSTPAVAGGCALLYQYFLNLGLNAPSPAMVKAFLMNAARYMTGVDANDTLWSNDQGMGGMNLGTAFDGTDRILRDQLTDDLFTATGQSRKFYGMVSDGGKPLRITLGWTDAPGATSGNAYKNNLDLVVMVGGVTYKGNVFGGAYSTNGGTADVRNNVESVFLPAGKTGLVQVTVSAININSDGVPNNGIPLDQDFALVAANATVFTPSNYPPNLDPIGNKTIATNRLMQFVVSASDPVDNDSVTLWATNVPPWATFAGATSNGSVSCTFSGTPMVTGAYAVTFYAGDKDGTNSETITVIANDIYCIPTNIVDEGFAGGLTPPTGWTFTGLGTPYTSVGNYGRASPSLKFDGTGYRLETPALNTPTNLQFWTKGQGTDSSSALLVEGLNGATWSTVGTVVPISTTATTQTMLIAEGISQLRFTYTKSVGNLAFDDVIIGGCGGSLPPTNRVPTISVAGGTNQGAVVGFELSFVVTANDADAEEVGLFTNAAPAGANFPDALGTAPIQSTFTWTPATTGVFTAEFVAFDAKVAVTQGVRIVVSATAQDLLPPVIQAASDVQANQFNANWLASSNATGYRLDVATNSDFSSGGGASVTNLSEDFSGFTAVSGTLDRSSTLDTYLHMPGWTGAAIYENKGTAKLGSSKAKGIITTPTVDLSANGGVATLKFDLGKYGTDAGLVQVMHAADGSIFTQVGSDLTPPASLTQQTIGITGGTALSKIRITAKSISNNRFYLDNAMITQSAPGRRYVPGYESLDVSDATTYAVTGLIENLMYYYRVRAYNATSNSANSGVTNVLTTASSNAAPVFTAPANTNQAGTVSNLVSFLVAATTVPDADDVTLWASGVPAWATFAGAASNTTASCTFAGTPTAAGTDIVTFYAGDKDGTNSRIVQIVVSSGGGGELLPPTILAASGVQTNRFNANWMAAANATGYRLDVDTNGSFSTGGGGGGTLLDYGFEGSAALPAGWASNSIYVGVGTNFAHTGTNYLGMNAAADWARTPPYENPGTLSFWVRTSTDPDSWTVAVQTSPNGTDWTARLTLIESGSSDPIGDVYILTNVVLNLSGSYYIRWYMSARSAGSCYIDDVVLTGTGGGASAYVPGYENRDVANVTTYAVTGLVENFRYYYRVRAYNATSNSANSGVTNVVTVGSAPEEPEISTFKVQAGATASATLNSVLGKTYVLQYTLDLTAVPAVWTDADTQAGTGGEITLADLSLADMTRIYRIVEQNP